MVPDLDWPVSGALCMCDIGERWEGHDLLVGLVLKEAPSFPSASGAGIRLWEIMTSRGIIYLPLKNIKPAQS